MQQLSRVDLRIETWQFYWYQNRRFFKPSFRFSESIGYKLYFCSVHLVYMKLNCYFFCTMDIPPWWGHNRPRRALMDEKAVSAPHTLPPQVEPQVQPEFQVASMSQPGYFPSMTPKAYQAYMNFSMPKHKLKLNIQSAYNNFYTTYNTTTRARG